MALPMTFACWKKLYKFRRYFHSSSLQWNKTCVRVRFAPSPTGFLHLGGLRTALYNFLFARSKNGQFILRVEDTDKTRIVPGALEQLEEVLNWCGIVADEGPSKEGKYGPYIQSSRLNIYQENIQTLLENGTAYRCFCSPKRLELIRKDAARRREIPKYDNRCRSLKQKEIAEKLQQNVPYVVRFKLEPITESWKDLVYGPTLHNIADVEGDPILMKTDQYPTYHFANVVDDHLMEITHVLRGVEWLTSTPKHLLLYKAFGWKPPEFAHLPLMVNKDGRKLSKRQGGVTVEHYKEQGYYPESLLSFITNTGSGFTKNTEKLILEEMIDVFMLSSVVKQPARLDFDKLNMFQKNHLERKLKNTHRQRVIDEVRCLVQKSFRERLTKSDLQTEILSDNYIGNVLDWSMKDGRVILIKDLVSLDFQFLWTIPTTFDKDTSEFFDTDIKSALLKFSELLNNFSSSDISHCTTDLNVLSKSLNIKYGLFMKLLRFALSGLKEGPPVAEILTVLGRDNAIARINHAICLLS